MADKIIVFADDDPASKAVARRISGRLSCEVLNFERASDVFNLIDVIDPKLVVLDMAMVNLDGVFGHKAGLEISAALRKIHHDRFPILIQIATESPALICECLRHGADDIFVKGADFILLVKRIAAWLVVDYGAGTPRRERETAADIVEALVATRDDSAMDAWRRLAHSNLSDDDRIMADATGSSGRLGDLFAWRSGKAASQPD